MLDIDDRGCVQLGASLLKIFIEMGKDGRHSLYVRKDIHAKFLGSIGSLVILLCV